MSVRFDSFEALALELLRQSDGETKISIVETRRVDIETTGSLFGNIMPCSQPNPEQALLRAEARLERIWQDDPSELPMAEFVKRGLAKI